MLKVSDMNLEDLRGLIGELIDERLGSPEPHSYRIGHKTPETWEAIWRGVAKSQGGAPSPSQLIREERERWANDT